MKNTKTLTRVALLVEMCIRDRGSSVRPTEDAERFYKRRNNVRIKITADSTCDLSEELSLIHILPRPCVPAVWSILPCL